jgi:hypothetical protein
MLQDDEVLSECGVVAGANLNLAIPKEVKIGQDGKAVGKSSPTTASAMPQNLNTGGNGIFNELGYSSAGVKPSEINSFMRNPLFKEMLKNVRANSKNFLVRIADVQSKHHKTDGGA